VLFSFFGERHEKQRSVFITTNLSFGEWDKVFKNPMTATAVVDASFTAASCWSSRARRASASRRPNAAWPQPDFVPRCPKQCAP